jgi:cellulose synthase/poly-beta-1,6-N-acetylglucosamine synthase-like glycosyltransferase
LTPLPIVPNASRQGGGVPSVVETTFWVCVLLVIYVYVGYPLTLLLLPGRPIRIQAGSPPPTVTVVIAAHNEVADIAGTVRNKLEQNYPAQLLDVIVVSDASSDGTDEAVVGLANPRVALLRQEPRQGKTAALNRGVEAARGDIVLVSDANSSYEVDAVRRLVEPFSDPGVGYVTGRLIYDDPGDTAVGGGSGLYMRYEGLLRRLETRVGSVIGVNGGMDAVRRRLYVPMRPDQLPDFVLPLAVVQGGKRVVYWPPAVAHELALGRQRDEFRMRVRVSLRSLHALWEERGLLRPAFGVFAFQLLVHKVLRYLLFVMLLGAFVSAGLLAGTMPYAVCFVAQAVFYAAAAAGAVSGGRVRARVIFVPFYFCLLNLAAAAALIRFVRGERQVLWTPRKGA